jgi:hypothetical protein
LQTGEEQVLHADDDTFIYVRTLANAEQVLVALNKGTVAHTIALPTTDTAIAGVHSASPLLGDSGAISVAPHQITLTLAPKSAAIAALK